METFMSRPTTQPAQSQKRRLETETTTLPRKKIPNVVVDREVGRGDQTSHIMIDRGDKRADSEVDRGDKRADNMVACEDQTSHIMIDCGDKRADSEVGHGDKRADSMVGPAGKTAYTLQRLLLDPAGRQFTQVVFERTLRHLIDTVKGLSKCNNWNIFAKERMDRICLSVLAGKPIQLEDKDKAYIRIQLKDFTCAREGGKLLLRNKDGKQQLDQTEVFDALHGVYVAVLKARGDTFKPEILFKTAKKSYNNITLPVVESFVHACLFLCIQHGMIPAIGTLPKCWNRMWVERKNKGAKFDKDEILAWLDKYDLCD